MNKLNGKRILLVCPSFPSVESGAEQMDRAEGIRQLVRLGYTVSVITKVTEWADTALIYKVAEKMGVEVTLVPYRYSNRNLSFNEQLYKWLGKLRNPLFLDGAAYEYAEPGIQKALSNALDAFNPNAVWFEYTYLWPLYKKVISRGIPIITRSLNFEPTHFLEEDGYSLINYLKCIPKYISEILVARKSALIVALSPNEATIYKKLGAKRVVVVPLRALHTLLRASHKIRDEAPLHVFFMGSSYKVAHNARALQFVVDTLARRVAREMSGQFVFHILGSKLPERYATVPEGVVYEGYIEGDEFDSFLNRMDIAISPSPKHVGMQQKVFEPLARGIPLITSRSNTMGYPLYDAEHFFAADSEDEYVGRLMSLRGAGLRAKLSHAASDQAQKLFNREDNDRRLKEALDSIN